MRGFLVGFGVLVLVGCASPGPVVDIGAADAVRFNRADDFAAMIEEPLMAAAGLDRMAARDLIRVSFTEEMVGRIDRVYPNDGPDAFGQRVEALLTAAVALRPDLSADQLVALSFDALSVERDPLTGRPRPVFGRLKDGDGTSFGYLQDEIFGARDDGPSGAPVLNRGGLPFPVLRVPVLSAESQAWETIRAELADPELQARPLVLDLRGNPGGLLEKVVDVASLGLPEAEVVLVFEGPSGISEEMLSRDDGITFPLVFVIVDERTNLGALAVAAALGERANGVVVGAVSDRVIAGITTVTPLFRVREFELCPVKNCFMALPTNVLLTPSGRRLSDGVDVDLPVDPGDEAAVRRAIEDEAVRRGF
ncbi:hypothetical protein HK107_09905 [Parvularcula sp. ZS-1/3]|uniref:Tail specific protease domain-containing protein n=1 Tax=Parvularcula mediterranea TaxID=2732508 RepID=A0A7Y3RM57_9PROT|nr:S41 family peptidase [Parvularcula mediterranea]NNU16634.1 hypothetical protein [Parvularcula mediterranea]